MPPKTQASQRNKPQAEHPPAASTQLVAITVDASELQVMIEMNKPITKRTCANDTTGTNTDAIPTKKKARAAPLPPDMAGPEVMVNLIPKGSETLQGQKGCNNHPRLVDQKRAKHTSAQVQAEKEAKTEAKR